AEDGIRDRNVTGVQTCALPICGSMIRRPVPRSSRRSLRRTRPPGVPSARQCCCTHARVTVMHPALQGALVGLGVGVFLLVFEYLALNKQVNERAKKYNKKAEFDVTERGRLATMRNFALMLPVGFAVAFWIIWG